MFGLVSSQKHKVMTETAAEMTLKYARLLLDWNTLIDRINARGGKALLERGVLPENAPVSLTLEDVKRLLQLSHPDKHNDSKLSVEMTQKLLSMKEKLK